MHSSKSIARAARRCLLVCALLIGSPIWAQERSNNTSAGQIWSNSPLSWESNAAVPVEPQVPAAARASSLPPEPAPAMTLPDFGQTEPTPVTAEKPVRTPQPVAAEPQSAPAVAKNEPSTSPSVDGEALPLRKPTGRFAADRSENAGTDRSSTGDLVLPIIALGGVLGLIVLLSRFAKKKMPFATQRLSNDVCEVLGRRPIDTRHSIIFLRTGQRILILGSSIDGLNTLAEITDPVEVDHINGQCRTAAETSDVGASFRMLLSRGTRESAAVNLDERHRKRQRERRSSHTSSQNQEDPGVTGISSDDIAELERTLSAAREGRL